MVKASSTRYPDRLAIAVFGIRRCDDPDDTVEDPCCPTYPDCDLCWFCDGWLMQLDWMWLYRLHIRRVERANGWDIEDTDTEEDPMPG